MWFILGYIAGFATIPLMVVAIRWMFDENLDDW